MKEDKPKFKIKLSDMSEEDKVRFKMEWERLNREQGCLIIKEGDEIKPVKINSRVNQK